MYSTDLAAGKADLNWLLREQEDGNLVELGIYPGDQLIVGDKLILFDDGEISTSNNYDVKFFHLLAQFNNVINVVSIKNLDTADGADINKENVNELDEGNNNLIQN